MTHEYSSQEDTPGQPDPVSAATPFLELDKIAQRIEKELRSTAVQYKDKYQDIAMDILILAKAAQTLRPSTSSSPTEYSQDPDLKKRSEQPKSYRRHALQVTNDEGQLIQYMQREKLSTGKLTTFLSKSDLPQSLQWIVQSLREET